MRSQLGIAGLLLIGIGVAPLAAQETARGNVLGVVSDARGKPITGASVSVVGNTATITTDERGRYGIVGLAVGMQLLRLKALGYQQRIVQVDISADETVDGSVEMRSAAQLLDTVRVVARGYYDKPARLEYTTRYDAFYERRRTGMGKYYTREQITSMVNVTRARDVVNRIPFYRVVGNGAHRCTVATFYLDGMRLANDEILDHLEASEIESVEYHRGVSDSPMGTQPCSLMVWTH